MELMLFWLTRSNWVETTLQNEQTHTQWEKLYIQKPELMDNGYLCIWPTILVNELTKVGGDLWEELEKLSYSTFLTTSYQGVCDRVCKLKNGA